MLANQSLPALSRSTFLLQDAAGLPEDFSGWTPSLRGGLKHEKAWGMERIRRVMRAVPRVAKQSIWLIRDSESDVADLYPEHRARGENAARHGSVFTSMSGVGRP